MVRTTKPESGVIKRELRAPTHNSMPRERRCEISAPGSLTPNGRFPMTGAIRSTWCWRRRRGAPELLPLRHGRMRCWVRLINRRSRDIASRRSLTLESVEAIAQ